MAFKDWACACFTWSAKKFLWVAWFANFAVAMIWVLCAIVLSKHLDGLYKKLPESDDAAANLVGGLVSTSAWGIVLIALFSIFSLVVLLRGTIALTGAGFSYGLIVGSAIHLFFAMVEVSVSLDAHEGWLHESLADVWTDKSQSLFAAVVGFGVFSAVCFLVLAIVMIGCMKAVMADKDEPYQSFRERYGVGQNNQPNQTPGAAGV